MLCKKCLFIDAFLVNRYSSKLSTNAFPSWALKLTPNNFFHQNHEKRFQILHDYKSQSKYDFSHFYESIFRMESIRLTQSITWKPEQLEFVVVVDYEIFMRQSAYKTAEIDLVKNRTNQSAFWEVKEPMKLNSVDRNHGYLNSIS